MKALFRKYLYDLRSSYWFIPTLMVVSSILLFWGSGYVDRHWSDPLLQHLPWLYSTQAAGARDLLSTIAGSMITVAGVTFSMTMVAVSFASSQFGPRLIGNFMRDRGNQLTLGTFIATFVYCMLLLRSVHQGSETDTSTYVPYFSVFIALLLALASIFVLIYFIHHVPETMNVSNIIARLGNQLKNDIVQFYGVSDDSLREDISAEDRDLFIEKVKEGKPRRLLCETHGYIQALETSTVIAMIKEHNLSIYACKTPGDFVFEGECMLEVSNADDLDDETFNELQKAFAFGPERTTTQNTLLLVDQLVEIAARALSPGMNDPFTACTCINWLCISVAQMAQSAAAPTGFYIDKKLVYFRAETNFEDFASAAFDQTRAYVASDRIATSHMIQRMRSVIDVIEDENCKDIIRKHLELLIEAAQEQLPLESDKSVLL